MKKQSILAMALALALTAAPFTAFAAPPEPPAPVERADNANLDGKEATSPQGGDGQREESDNGQHQGDSYGFAEVRSSDRLVKNTVSGDDDDIAEATEAQEGQNADINVWAKVEDETSRIYKIDIAWGAMRFEFVDGSGTWDPEEHEYVGKEEDVRPHWVNSAEIDENQGGYGIYEKEAYKVGADGTNNKITVTNHSNSAVNARFDYTMAGPTQPGAGGPAATPFNDGAYGNAGFSNNYLTHREYDVIGRFYGDNGSAQVAHALISGTFDGKTEESKATGGKGGMTEFTSWEYYDSDEGEYTAIGNGPGTPKALTLEATFAVSDGEETREDTIILPTSEYSKTGIVGEKIWPHEDASSLDNLLSGFHDDDSDAENTYKKGGRSADVYFAFSGQPDRDQGNFLSGFTKVGYITVTISPNDVDTYNTAKDAPF
jgi:hypothetical protein